MHLKFGGRETAGQPQSRAYTQVPLQLQNLLFVSTTVLYHLHQAQINHGSSDAMN